MIKVGLIGAGKIADTFHLPAWETVEGARVMALVDPRIGVANELGKKYAIKKTYDTLRDMLESTQLDAVDICSPHALHAEHACEALRAGLHCFVEKPFATSARDAKKIAREAAKNARIVMCGQHQRFRPESIVLKSMIDAGEFGEIYHIKVEAMAARGIPVQVANSFTDKKLSGGGPLIDQGSHGLDIAWWFMGCPKPMSAFAVVSGQAVPKTGRAITGATWSVYNVEDFATAIIRFEDNRSITVRTCYFSNCLEDVFGCEILGTKAGATWPELRVTQPDGGHVKRTVITTDNTALASVSELNHFVALIEKRCLPVIPIEHSITLTKMIDGLYESARTETVVNF
ncbi:MAG: hypothetical protein CMM58_04985 [Rhodospirillaceae bacterium]|nr:hypothetical protein [Rhodospirillaceae bacterium]|tara:strand:+ start:436 stop:1467 length:1032 start_codon:yes stop_codon:yes gene_type:complete